MANTAAPTTRTTTAKAFPLRFVLVTFAFTWAFWLLAVLEARGMTSSLPVPALFFGALGPMVAAVVLTAQEGGRAELRSLLNRVVRWRVAPFWYGVALLGPFVLQLGAMALHVLLGGQPPDLLAMIEALPTVLALSVYMFIQVGIGEEIGWRGYALPKLQTGYSALISSLILGVIWVLWHLPLFFNPATSYNSTPFWVFLVFLLPLPIVYTWIFNSTGGSVLMAMILHAVTNASSGPLWRATAEYSTTVSSTNVYLIQAALLWIGAIVLVLVYGATDLSRKPKQVLVAPTRDELQPRVR
jgi:membrane protease YdiL (CAAX protease family)